MKIGVVGCGAIGSFYGAKLLQTGNEVHFLLRSDYEVVKSKGVFIESINGDFHVNPIAAKDPEEIGVCDWVFIGLKTTANYAFQKLLTPLVGDNTAIVTLQNGLGSEEALAGLFGADKVLGGLCFVCLNRIKPGYIRHIEHGRITLGEFGRKAQPRTYQIAKILESVGVPCSVVDNLQKAHWEKLLWNIPYNGLGVAAAAGFDTVISGGEVDLGKVGECFPTNKIHADKHWENLLIELMEEVWTAGNALGLDISHDKVKANLDSTACMGEYWASTLLDFKNRKPLEIDTLFKNPLAIGQKAGVNMPRLENMCKVLEQLAKLCR